MAVKQRPPGCKVSHDLVVIYIIYWFNYFLGQFRHQWIHNISVTTQRVFSPPFRGSPPPPANLPYVITCSAGEKLSKMAGNSASKPSKRTLYYYRLMENFVDEATCILEIHSTVFKISKRDFSIFIIACIRPLLANSVTYIKTHNNELWGQEGATTEWVIYMDHQ